MDSLKKVSTQTLWQLLGKAVSALLGLFILSLITRTYGEAGTGLFTLALTYLALFGVVVEFGMNAHLLPQLMEQPQKIFSKLLGLRILFSLLLVILALIIAPLLPVKEGFVWAVVLGLGVIIGSAIFDTINLVFQSKQRFDLSNLASSLGVVGGTVLAYYLISNHSPVSTLLLSESLGWLIYVVVGLILIKRFVKAINPILDLNFIKDNFISSWPLAATLILNIVYFRLDAFLLQYFKGLAEVGVYNLSYQLFQSALVLPTFIMNSYYPLMLNFLKEGRTLFFGQLKKALGAMLGLSLLGIGVTWLIAPLVIELITSGQGFTGSVSSLQFLSLGFPAYFLTSVLMWVMVSLKRYKPLLLIYLLGLGINTLLNLIFIPHYSYIAASLSTGVSEYLILVLQIIILWKYI